ncbi:MAG TPA: OsmC family protein, partial [Candidatus Sulfotelmatobacter sp.]|nr:OsmC family protein [Candidatus Sulfotelmatobacter sp.]
AYSRDYRVELPGKPPFTGSADAAFLGDAALPNPEDMLLVALSTCHMLSYLALCARAGIAVLAYEDEAAGEMTVRQKALRFTDVLLRPKVVLAPDSDRAAAEALHEKAHRQCFIANSVNFPVRHAASISVAQG